MLMLVPGLLKDFEAFSACPEENLDMHISILQGAKSLLVFLFQWRWHWQDRAGHEVGRDVGFASPEIGSSGELTKLRFRHFVLATDIMLYNSTLMWLMALISKLDPRNAILHIQECGTVAASQDGRSTQDRNDFEPLHRPGAVINMRDAALEIGRVFEWSSRHHDRSKETNCLYLFPVGMALTVLRAETNAVAWIQGLLNRSLATASYATRDNQSGFGFYLADETSFTDPGMLKVKQQLFSEQDVENSSKLGGQTRGVSPPQAGSHAALGSWQTIGS